MGKQIRHFESRLAALLERPFGAEENGGLQLPIHEVGVTKTLRRVLAVELGKQRLGIERVNVARPALHKQMNHALRGSRPRRLFGSEWIGNLLRAKQIQGGEPADAESGRLKKLPPGSVSPHR